MADKELFSLLWTEEILEEAHRNLVAQTKCTQESADRRKAWLREALAEGEVTDYAYLEPCLTCNADDRHVLAAAIVGSADQIVTFNLKDFPASALSSHNVEAIHPDDFLLNVLDLYTSQTVAAVHEQVADLKNPPLTIFELLQVFTRAGVPDFSQAIENIEKSQP